MGFITLGTFPETNIAPQNGRLEDEFSFWDGLFSGATLVSGSVFNLTHRRFTFKVNPPENDEKYQVTKVCALEY